MNNDKNRCSADSANQSGSGTGNGAGQAGITADDIEFSDKFSIGHNKTQVTRRGWTSETIAETINNPQKTDTSINKYTGNTVTVYYCDEIHYVAVDDGTGKVIQVADLNDSEWKFDVNE